MNDEPTPTNVYYPIDDDDSPSPFSACHATVTSLNDAVDRLRQLRDGRDA